MAGENPRDLSAFCAPPSGAGTGRRYVVIGDNPLARRICKELAGKTHLVHLPHPDDKALIAVMSGRPLAVAIAMHDDVSALRYALAVAHIDDSTRIVVTIFDRTVASRITDVLPQAVVTSAADVAAPILAAACMRAPGSPNVLGIDGRQSVFGRTVRDRIVSWIPHLRTQNSHTQLLILGVAGLVTVLLLDWLWLTTAGHQGVVHALLDAARVVATVGPGSEDVSAGYALFSAASIVATLVLTAMFTAGLVQRLLEPGLLGMFGKRSAPRANHVIVVGIGQVGVRLCAELRRLGVPVVGVERNPSAPQLRLARSLKIPVVVGQGMDREYLERLHLRRARALAAVGSNEFDNIAVAVAASAVAPETPVVLRAGEQEAIVETRSLLSLGQTRDVLDLTAAFMVKAMGVENENSGDKFVGRSDSGPCEHRPPQYWTEGRSIDSTN